MGANGSTGTPVTVCVQHRLRLLRVGLAHALDDEADITVVGTAVTASDLAALAGRVRPDVVVLEVDDDGSDACRAAAAVRSRASTGQFVAVLPPGSTGSTGLSPAAETTFPVRVSRADGLRAVRDAVRAAPHRFVSPVVVPEEGGRDMLSPRELDVLALVGAGCTTREISERLSISRKTVENHKQHIFTKLQVRNQAHAVAVALRAGMISVDGVIDLREVR